MTDPAEVFAADRDRLVGLAYRMLGSIVDAEDVVQQAWLRWSDADHDRIRNPAAWLTTVVSRLAVDRLRQQRRRREDYVGPWLPEPVLTRAAGGTGPTDLAEVAALADSVTFGFLVVLDRLSPIERAVFVLADVFGEPFPAVAEIVGKSPDACRQIATRARRKVRDERAASRPADPELLGELVGALAEGSVDKVLALLSDDVVVVSDGGPRRRAARRPVVGPDRVARLMISVASRTPEDAQLSIEELNGGAALVIRSEDLNAVVSAERDPGTGRITRIHVVMNPDKLGALGRDAPVT